jgi:hypothetical protein
VVIGAIIIIGAVGEQATPGAPEGGLPQVVEGSLGCVEILGRSVVERMVERFLSADVEVVSVVADARAVLPSFCVSSNKVTAQVVDDMGPALSRILHGYSERGVGFAFVTHANVYTECDLIDWIWFHRGTHRAITRACDRNGSLDFWVVDCAQREEVEVSWLIKANELCECPSYFIKEYVNQVATASDVRRMVTDAFRGCCEMRPSGREIRPGVWVGAGAQIHRRARVIAPAYVGCGTQVREDTLVTRCSNLESSCYIDYGTVIEDSSILSNSYVGIWLDVSHAIVKGNKVANVERDVMLEISDRSVMREKVAIGTSMRTLAGHEVGASGSRR